MLRNETAKLKSSALRGSGSPSILHIRTRALLACVRGWPAEPNRAHRHWTSPRTRAPKQVKAARRAVHKPSFKRFEAEEAEEYKVKVQRRTVGARLMCGSAHLGKTTEPVVLSDPRPHPSSHAFCCPWNLMTLCASWGFRLTANSSVAQSRKAVPSGTPACPNVATRSKIANAPALAPPPNHVPLHHSRLRWHQSVGCTV